MHFYGVYNNVYTAINDLQKTAPENGGICSIYFAKIEDVLTWPIVNPTTGIIDTPLVLKDGKTSYIIYCVDRGRMFTENQKSSTAGVFYEQIVTIPMLGDNTDNLLILRTMMFHQYIVIITERNGTQRLIGNEDAGAQLQQKTYSSGDPANSRKRAFQFYFESPQEAPVYTGIIPMGHIEFTEEFSNEFK